MTTEELKKEIEEIIDETFKELSSIYNNKKTGDSHIIFPKYRNDKIRVSEQELRCVFIQKLCKRKKELYYSVETPTNEKYKFTDENKSRNNPKIDKSGRSGCIDLSIHDSNHNLLCIIEFKAHGKTSESDYKKDLLKLCAEQGDNVLRYFIQIFELCVPNTLYSIWENKLKPSAEHIKTECKLQDIRDVFTKVHCRFCVLSQHSDFYNQENLHEKIIKVL